MSFPQALRWCLVFVAFAVAGYLVIGGSMKKAVKEKVVDQIVEGLADETAETRFMSYATTVSPLKRIELAKLQQLEMFERTSKLKLFWQSLNLPDVVVRATVPVEYRYYVDLNDSWKVTLKGANLEIVAPSLKPGTPSPNISKLQFEVRKGSLFRNEERVTQGLQSEMTKLLEKRAEESSHLVRETAREQIIQLAQQWLTSESKVARIEVRFANEPIKPGQY